MSGYVISELDKQAARTQQLLTAAFNRVSPQDVINAFSNSRDGKAHIKVSVKPDNLHDRIMGIRAYAPAATMNISEVSRNEGFLNLRDILNKEGIDVEITHAYGQTTDERKANLVKAYISRGGLGVAAIASAAPLVPFIAGSLGLGALFSFFNLLESQTPEIYLKLKRQTRAPSPTNQKSIIK